MYTAQFYLIIVDLHCTRSIVKNNYPRIFFLLLSFFIIRYFVLYLPNFKYTVTFGNFVTRHDLQNARVSTPLIPEIPIRMADKAARISSHWQYMLKRSIKNGTLLNSSIILYNTEKK